MAHKKEDAFFILALKAISSLLRKYMFLSNVLKPFCFFELFSYMVFFSNCVGFSSLSLLQLLDLLPFDVTVLFCGTFGGMAGRRGT